MIWLKRMPQYTQFRQDLLDQIENQPIRGNQTVKLIMHTSIFSIAFAGILASALTTKPTMPAPASHSLVVPFAMPVPNCDPNTGCPN